MGYSESQAAQNYNGLCITCYVKERVENKIMTGKEPVIPSTQKSIETVFNKFQDILVTTEVSTNLKDLEGLQNPGVLNGVIWK